MGGGKGGHTDEIVGRAGGGGVEGEGEEGTDTTGGFGMAGPPAVSLDFSGESLRTVGASGEEEESED